MGRAVSCLSWGFLQKRPEAMKTQLNLRNFAWKKIGQSSAIFSDFVGFNKKLSRKTICM